MSYFEAMKRIAEQMEAIRRYYTMSMMKALEPLQRIAKVIKENPYLGEILDDLREDYSSEHISSEEAEFCLNCIKEKLTQYSLNDYVDKAIVSGNVIETISKRFAWMQGKSWNKIPEQDKENIREKIKLEYKSRAYAFSAYTPFGKFGVIVVGYVDEPDDYYVHDILHETLHLKHFEDYPHLEKLTDEELKQVYEQNTGKEPKDAQLFHLRNQKMLLMDMFVEKELLEIAPKIATSTLARDLQEWLEAKSDFLEMQETDKVRVIIGLDMGILPVYLRYRYLKSELEEDFTEIEELLSWFPEDIRQKLIALGDLISKLHPNILSAEKIIQIYNEKTDLILDYGDYLGFDFTSIFDKKES